MHVREYPAVALFLAAEGQVWIKTGRELPSVSLAQYWTASKCRLDRWGRALREYRELQHSRATVQTSWRNVRALFEEVLVSEMLTRIWSGLVSILDRTGGDAQPMAASVMAGHIEASNRVLDLLNSGRHAPPGPSAEINQLRRLTERWTDLLLACLSSAGDVSTVCYDAHRTQEFAAEFAAYDRPATWRQAWALLSASLRGAFQNRLAGDAVNGDLNNRIVGAIVGCFPHEAFDSSGAYRSLWLQRITSSAADTEFLVNDLLASEEAPPESPNDVFVFARGTRVRG